MSRLQQQFEYFRSCWDSRVRHSGVYTEWCVGCLWYLTQPFLRPLLSRKAYQNDFGRVTIAKGHIEFHSSQPKTSYLNLHWAQNPSAWMIVWSGSTTTLTRTSTDSFRISSKWLQHLFYTKQQLEDACSTRNVNKTVTIQETDTCIVVLPITDARLKKILLIILPATLHGRCA